MATGVTRTTISLPDDLASVAELRARKLGYRSFSEYISFLIHTDVNQRPVHSVVREESGVVYSRSQGQKQNKK